MFFGWKCWRCVWKHETLGNGTLKIWRVKILQSEQPCSRWWGQWAHHHPAHLDLEIGGVKTRKSHDIPIIPVGSWGSLQWVTVIPYIMCVYVYMYTSQPRLSSLLSSYWIKKKQIDLCRWMQGKIAWREKKENSSSPTEGPLIISCTCTRSTWTNEMSRVTETCREPFVSNESPCLFHNGSQKRGCLRISKHQNGSEHLLLVGGQHWRNRVNVGHCCHVRPPALQ